MSRQRIPRRGSVGAYYGLRDFYYGAWHDYYGQRVCICDSSDASKSALHVLGYDFGVPIERPLDSSLVARRDSTLPRTHVTHDKAHDARWRSDMFGSTVLRFYAILDERFAFHGYLLKVHIHYYLEDGTIEIVQPKVPNDGRDPPTGLIGLFILHFIELHIAVLRKRECANQGESPGAHIRGTQWALPAVPYTLVTFHILARC